MNQNEFKREMKAIIDAYPGNPPGKNWPQARIEAFWNAFQLTPDFIFRKACIAYIGSKYMPPGIPEIRELVEQFSSEESGGTKLSQEEFDRRNPIQPNAKELGAKYGSAVMRLLAGGNLSKPLPYNPNRRIDDEEQEGA